MERVGDNYSRGIIEDHWESIQGATVGLFFSRWSADLHAGCRNIGIFNPFRLIRNAFDIEGISAVDISLQGVSERRSFLPGFPCIG